MLPGFNRQTIFLQGRDPVADRHLDFLDDVVVMVVYVVKDGRIEKRVYTAADLSKLSFLSIPGYINGLVLLSREPLHAFANRTPLNPIITNAAGYYKVENFGYMSPEQLRATFCSDGKTTVEDTRIRGRYSSFPEILGDALCQNGEFEILLMKGTEEYHLPVHQQGRVKLSRRHTPTADVECPEVYYLGNDENGLNPASMAFQERLRSIFTGISNVQDVTGLKVVDTIQIIDYDDGFNAYTCEGKNCIWLYTRLFRESSVSELRNIAEHEAMHILTDRLGLAKCSKMRELYCELMGYGMLSLARFSVMLNGHPPAKIPVEDESPETGILFDFINERNFTPGMNGGHSRDNLDEFCASFLHTVLYPNRLQEVIEQPLWRQDGSLAVLTADERTCLIDGYVRALDIVGEILPSEPPVELTSLVKSCFEMVRSMGWHIFPDGRPDPSITEESNG